MWSLTAACVEPITFQELSPAEPQLRTPMNGAYVGSTVADSLQPRLTWTHEKAHEDELYEVEVSADRMFGSIDHFGSTASPTFTPHQSLEVSRIVPVGRRYYWRVRACRALRCSSYSPVRWFDLGRSANDFNGDGYADVLIGDPDLGGGRLVLYLGGPGDRFSTAPAGELTAGTFAAVGDRFGASHAAAGDTNGDGYADLLVGAPNSAHADGGTGRAFLFYGGPTAKFLTDPGYPLVTRDRVAGYGATVSGAGDINGDGYADLLVGEEGQEAPWQSHSRFHRYLGSRPVAFGERSALPGALSAHAGITVAAVSDVDGDGLADVVVSRGDFPNPDAREAGCSAEVSFGASDPNLARPRTWDLSDFRFCTTRAEGLGDIDGDGRADLAVAVNHPDGAPFLSLYRGSEEKSAGARHTLLSFPAGRLHTFVPVDDLNGDGQIDLVVSPVLEQPRAAVYAGEYTEGLLAFREVAGLYGAVEVASAGDLNGDGIGDLVASDPAMSGGGQVRVYFGSIGLGFDDNPDGELRGGAGFGVLMKSLPPRVHKVRWER